MPTNYEGEAYDFKEDLPLLPVRDIVVYPFMILPLFVGRKASIAAVEESIERCDRLILLSSQKDIRIESPKPEGIYQLGTVAMIMRMRKLADGRIKILVQGLSKASIQSFIQEDPFFMVKVNKIDCVPQEIEHIALESLMRTARERLEQIIAMGRILSPDILMVLEDINDPGRLSDLIASNLNLKVEDAQMILETIDPIERLHKVNQILSRELDSIRLQTNIRSTSIMPDSIKSHKELILREQIKAIKSELGEESTEQVDEFSEMKEKILALKMLPSSEKEILKQLSRLERMHPESSESNILRNYLDCVLELPWSISTDENLDLKIAKDILDHDHFELTKVKERILEYLAVRVLKGSVLRGPILCLMGPPGVGKTSLGKSIAKSMGREFVRISLGGVKDEAEIRGHRRTYVGSMPGRFIQALQQAGSNNPIIMLDEIDKLGSDFRGDPASALLEVLDPEQNCSFRDHYLNIAFDLSNVVFIATANSIENIPPALKDRLEIISLSGYTEEEKVAISHRYLVPKQIDENGISKEHVNFQDAGIVHLVRGYTCEAGLRTLERMIGSVCRKIARKVALGEIEMREILPDSVETLLGPPLYNRDDTLDEAEVGVVNGLAWTSAGGEVLRIEATKMKGKGLTLTGQLGDVMKESAQAAVAFIRTHANRLGIDENFTEHFELHIHVPNGATPKDGPSAGITLATAIYSLLSGKKTKASIAMTGEITLSGKVLPVGGIKEKAPAAMRFGVDTIILPKRNQKDLNEIPESYKGKVTFILVDHVNEVFSAAFLEEELNSSKQKIKSEKLLKVLQGGGNEKAKEKNRKKSKISKISKSAENSHISRRGAEKVV